jgi:hypothetical protein
MHISKDKIDQLFSEKLDNHTVKPRAEAWEKLENRLEKSKKKLIPFWQKLSIAASVAVLLLAGGVAYFEGNEDKLDTNLNNSVAVENNTNTIAKPKGNLASPHNISEKNVNYSASLATTNNTKTAIIPAHTELFANSQKPENQETNPRVDQEDHNIDLSQTVAQNTPEESEIEKNIGKVESKITPAKADEDLTIVFTVADFQQNEQEYASTPETTKKPKYLSRVFKQLMNAKNGDRVNWDDVGFKPAKILARAENKLKNTKDDINDSYQTVKNKTVY